MWSNLGANNGDKLDSVEEQKNGVHRPFGWRVSVVRVPDLSVTRTIFTY